MSSAIHHTKSRTVTEETSDDHTATATNNHHHHHQHTHQGTTQTTRKVSSRFLPPSLGNQRLNRPTSFGTINSIPIEIFFSSCPFLCCALIGIIGTSVCALDPLSSRPTNPPHRYEVNRQKNHSPHLDTATCSLLLTRVLCLIRSHDCSS